MADCSGPMNGLADENISNCSRSGCTRRTVAAMSSFVHSSHPRLHERAIEAEIDVGYPGDRLELAVVAIVVAAERPDVVERPRLEAHQIVAADKVRGTLSSDPSAP